MEVIRGKTAPSDDKRKIDFVGLHSNTNSCYVFLERTIY